MFLGKSLCYGQPWLERCLGQYGVRLGAFGVTTLSCEAGMGRSGDSLMLSRHGDPVSFSFAGLQYVELLISGQRLGMAVWGPVWGGREWTPSAYSLSHPGSAGGWASTPLQLFWSEGLDRRQGSGSWSFQLAGKFVQWPKATTTMAQITHSQLL